MANTNTKSNARKGSIKYLHNAKSQKIDEFYTILSDIEKELRHYKKHFKNKPVLCNCADPRVSNFFHYFSYNFEQLGLKKLITTCYKNQQMELFSTHDSERAIWMEYNGDKNKNKIHKYTNIAYDEVLERPNIWYIFEKRIVQGYQK